LVWQQVRATVLHRFPYVLYYRVLEHEVEVLAIVHGSRDEQAWKDRVQQRLYDDGWLGRTA
jgi:plasmid stabilization system protein ParE